MADDMVIACANPDCRVAETGRCVEGLQLENCPHYGHVRDDGQHARDAEVADDGFNDHSIRLASGGTLDPVQASAVLRQVDARVIAVLGPSDSGKTSLIASLYDLFQEGPVAGIEFSRSRTLLAFEQTCHDARAASRRATPHMNRTPIGDVRFYHLELGGEVLGKRIAVLLGDRAGEDYRAAADDVSVAQSFSETVRADALTVLVDGERLLDAGARHNVCNDAIMMLQGLQDGGGMPCGKRLAVVLTKLDVITSTNRAEQTLRDFETLVCDIERIFGTTFIEIERFLVAASPKTNALSRGTGVSDLLVFWLKPVVSLRTAVAPNPACERAFGRLTAREESLEMTRE